MILLFYQNAFFIVADFFSLEKFRYKTIDLLFYLTYTKKSNICTIDSGKGVVDLEQEIIALDADMHFELADFLKEMKDSKDNQLHGFPRGGMNILSPEIEAKATEVICKWILF